MVQGERANERDGVSHLALGCKAIQPLKFLAPPNGSRYVLIAPTELGINDSTACSEVISKVSVALFLSRSKRASLDGNVSENHRGVNVDSPVRSLHQRKSIGR